jgi:hypothetical protein
MADTASVPDVVLSRAVESDVESDHAGNATSGKSPDAFVVEIQDGGAVSVTTFNSARELEDFVKGAADDLASRVYGIRGVPEEYTQVVIDHLHVEHGFINAHEKRRAFMPQRRDQEPGHRHHTFRYPEIVRRPLVPIRDEQEHLSPHGDQPHPRGLIKPTMKRPVRLTLGERPIDGVLCLEQIALSQASLWLLDHSGDKYKGRSNIDKG